MRASTSFSEEEIAVGEALCREESMRPRSGRARSKAFASFWKKMQAMAEKVRSEELAQELARVRRVS